MAAAIRSAQLVSEQPEVAERLGEVPVAVLEKGKAPGSHLLSGAVIDPDDAASSSSGSLSRRSARCPASRFSS